MTDHLPPTLSLEDEMILASTSLTVDSSNSAVQLASREESANQCVRNSLSFDPLVATYLSDVKDTLTVQVSQTHYMLLNFDRRNMRNVVIDAVVAALGHEPIPSNVGIKRRRSELHTILQLTFVERFHYEFDRLRTRRLGSVGDNVITIDDCPAIRPGLDHDVIVEDVDQAGNPLVETQPGTITQSLMPLADVSSSAAPAAPEASSTSQAALTASQAATTASVTGTRANAVDLSHPSAACADSTTDSNSADSKATREDGIGRYAKVIGQLERNQALLFDSLNSLDRSTAAFQKTITESQEALQATMRGISAQFTLLHAQQTKSTSPPVVRSGRSAHVPLQANVPGEMRHGAGGGGPAPNAANTILPAPGVGAGDAISRQDSLMASLRNGVEPHAVLTALFNITNGGTYPSHFPRNIRLPPQFEYELFAKLLADKRMEAAHHMVMRYHGGPKKRFDSDAKRRMITCYLTLPCEYVKGIIFQVKPDMLRLVVDALIFERAKPAQRLELQGTAFKIKADRKFKSSLIHAQSLLAIGKVMHELTRAGYQLDATYVGAGCTDNSDVLSDLRHKVSAYQANYEDLLTRVTQSDYVDAPKGYTHEQHFVAYFFLWSILLHEFSIFIEGHCPSLDRTVTAMLQRHKGKIPKDLTKDILAWGPLPIGGKKTQPDNPNNNSNNNSKSFCPRHVVTGDCPANAACRKTSKHDGWAKGAAVPKAEGEQPKVKHWNATMRKELAKLERGDWTWPEDKIRPDNI